MSSKNFVHGFIKSTYQAVNQDTTLEAKGATLEAQQDKLKFAITALESVGTPPDSLQAFLTASKLIDTEMQAIELRLELSAD